MKETGLKPDGERFLPEFQGIIELEHYHRYHLALNLVSGKDVLDIASGEGFGSAILARSAKSVTGVDVSQEAVEHAKAKYSKDGLRFICGSATKIPLDSDAVDVVISFETIEHLIEHDQMLAEVKRVLKPDGVLLISSPNKYIYSDKPNYNNPFHVRELYTAEFKELVSRYFENIAHYGQRVVTASVIAASETASEIVSYRDDEVFVGFPDQMYDVILASDVELPQIAHSLFEYLSSGLQPEKMEEIRKTFHQVSNELSQVKADRDYLSNRINEVATERDRLIRRLRNMLPNARNLGEGTSLEEMSPDEVKALLQRVADDGNKVVGDKWWRRTRSLRRWSNSIRKWKGKAKKVWPERFSLGDYLPSLAEQTAAIPSHLQQETAAVPAVQYSAVEEGFVEYRDYSPIKTDPKLIAFYLPQFHPFKENDTWWGKGVTEWTNVTKSLPLFEGHHQPHYPIHLGYYDLRVKEIMEEQARLAQSYGVSGFAYYFYWFAGKVLMDLPLQQMLANPKVDIPFCMIWANENWTRRWDGQEHEILIAQDHSLEDSRAMLEYLRPFLEDARYIKIDGKPLFIVYRAAIISDMAATLDAWREQAKAFGFPGLYCVCAQNFGHSDPREFGFDAAMEFPPHAAPLVDISHEVKNLRPEFTGSICDYKKVVSDAVTRTNKEYKVFPTAMLSWDNTARRGDKATLFENFSLKDFSHWLSHNAERVVKDPDLSPSERIMFVNAWNEWAEGTHLEPDRKHGFGYLAATRSVMENYEASGDEFQNPRYPKATESKYAVLVHIHYESAWSDVLKALNSIEDYSPDVYVTVTSLSLAQKLKSELPNAIIEFVDNRGRDIRPFLHVFRKIAHLNYVAICKVHGKASIYRNDGELLRRSALSALLSKASVEKMIADDHIGMLVPSASLVAHSEKNMHSNQVHVEKLADQLGIKDWWGDFPAGSMFWFRPASLMPLQKIDGELFDVERGMVDGTFAHAIERLFNAVCKSEGFIVEVTPT